MTHKLLQDVDRVASLPIRSHGSATTCEVPANVVAILLCVFSAASVGLSVFSQVLLGWVPAAALFAASGLWLCVLLSTMADASAPPVTFGAAYDRGPPGAG